MSGLNSQSACQARRQVVCVRVSSQDATKSSKGSIKETNKTSPGDSTLLARSKQKENMRRSVRILGIRLILAWRPAGSPGYHSAQNSTKTQVHQHGFKHVGDVGVRAMEAPLQCPPSVT